MSQKINRGFAGFSVFVLTLTALLLTSTPAPADEIPDGYGQEPQVWETAGQIMGMISKMVLSSCKKNIENTATQWEEVKFIRAEVTPTVSPREVSISCKWNVLLKVKTGQEDMDPSEFWWAGLSEDSVHNMSGPCRNFLRSAGSAETLNIERKRFSMMLAISRGEVMASCDILVRISDEGFKNPSALLMDVIEHIGNVEDS